ncbi:hypothetical protein ABZ780_22145 [Micromonospora sp. NPDC047467]|uniref:hypothetical protein n=1 Tax=Micromonospora sp. NPDC047467 TaxID=3154814 RepID=UPI0033CC3F7A
MIGNLDAEQRFILEHLDFKNGSGYLTEMVDEWSLVADCDRDAATSALSCAVEELERRGLAVREDSDSGYEEEIEIHKGTEIPKLPSLEEATAAMAEALANRAAGTLKPPPVKSEAETEVEELNFEIFSLAYTRWNRPDDADDRQMAVAEMDWDTARVKILELRARRAELAAKSRPV